MTREMIRPSWSWVCDGCGATHGLAYTQHELPAASTMKRRGWQISLTAPVKDLCLGCRARASVTPEQFNAKTPIGTPVTYWPGARRGPGVTSKTRTPAWSLGGHTVVSVEGYAGGIALTHVEVIEP